MNFLYVLCLTPAAGLLILLIVRAARSKTKNNELKYMYKTNELNRIFKDRQLEHEREQELKIKNNKVAWLKKLLTDDQKYWQELFVSKLSIDPDICGHKIMTGGDDYIYEKLEQIDKSEHETKDNLVKFKTLYDSQVSHLFPQHWLQNEANLRRQGQNQGLQSALGGFNNQLGRQAQAASNRGQAIFDDLSSQMGTGF